MSSDCSIYKTESFIRATNKISHIDAFVSKIAEGIIPYLFEFEPVIRSREQCSVMAETEDKSYSLFFRFGSSINNASLTDKDIVFYNFVSKNKSDRKNDRQLINYLSRYKKFNAVFRTVTDFLAENEFAKIYTLSDDDRVNFPLLNPVQREIVETENKNILVQGVAGSGKTNVCIDKILYCACRGYSGKTLYTTYSRGLLIETKNRVEVLNGNLKKFISAYESGNIVFMDKNHKKALENRLGIYFNSDDDDRIIDKIRAITEYLTKKTDYFLLEDLYSEYVEREYSVFDESRFLKEYIGDIKNYRLSGTLEKIMHLSLEVIYKEIFGMIYGRFEPDSPKPMMSREEYSYQRRNSFGKIECDTIYTLALDYGKYLDKNHYVDNNSISRILLEKIQSPIYSVAVIDEVQDFTQVNLYLIKQIALKLCCVGDALQMINPSYFSFGYLKKIMYGGDKTAVTELKHNYRNSEQIEKIVEKLGELNIKQFGTHNFVIKGKSVENGLPAAAVYVDGKDFIKTIANDRFDNATVIVSCREKKDELRKILKKTEILTVSEAKGLERNTVILCDILSDNSHNWNMLQKSQTNRKTADENSVFRYYFNLFYVGVSRAKQYLFVTENNPPRLFDSLFSDCFTVLPPSEALATLTKIADKIELDDDELVSRIQKFVELEQYENARFTADRLSDDNVRTEELQHIDIAEKYIKFGKYREAGVEYWKRDMPDDAKKMFRISHDEKLIELMEASYGKDNKLDANIVSFYPLVMDNEIAKNIIFDALKSDYKNIWDMQTSIKETLKRNKGVRHE